MTRVTRSLNAFVAGEIDPALMGRIDLNIYANGARELTNVVVAPTGGVARRPGLEHETTVPGARRLAAFDDEEGGFLVALGGGRIRKIENAAVTSDIEAPWTDAQIDVLDWARVRDGLMFCHPDHPPRILEVEDDGGLRLGPIFWREDASGAVKKPYARFADRTVTMRASAAGIGVDQPIPAGTNVTLTTSDDFFSIDHIGEELRIRGALVVVSTISTPTIAIANARQEIPSGEDTLEWDEAALSKARGWPRAVTMHQDRLVFGGSRSRPDQVWMSKTGDPFDFDLGEGLDDEAIVFRLVDDRAHHIRALHSGRDLQVFTDAGEWAVLGSPVTPIGVSVQQQTRIGVAGGVARHVASVDGATMFLAADGRELREFVFTDAEQAYQAVDVANFARHMLVDPVAMDFYRPLRLLFVVRGDGDVAAMTFDRLNDVIAWSRFSTDGAFLDVLSFTERCYFLIERDGEARVERLSPAARTDAARRLEDSAPRTAWAGFDHLVGQTVDVIADDRPIARLELTAGGVNTGAPALRVEVGLPVVFAIEPLPLANPGSSGLTPHRAYRPFAAGFRARRADRVRVDLGDGFLELRPDPALDSAIGLDDLAFEGDVRAHAYGWRRGWADAPWRIEDDRPRAFELLSATLETKVND